MLPKTLIPHGPFFGEITEIVPGMLNFEPGLRIM